MYTQVTTFNLRVRLGSVHVKSFAITILWTLSCMEMICVTACIESWLEIQPQPTQEMGWLGPQTLTLTRPTGSGKAWSLAGLCVLALVRLSLFSSLLSDSKFTLSLLLFTSYRCFLLPNVGCFYNMRLRTWLGDVYLAQVESVGKEVLKSRESCKSKGRCHNYEI